MARIQFTVESPRTPAQVRAALLDFSEQRPDLWPAIDPAAYRVHDIGEGWAEVTEGSAVMGGIWARERYDWSAPDVIRATIQEANLWEPGGTWEMRVEPAAAGGSLVEVTRDRTARTVRGHLLEGMLRVVGRRMLSKDLANAPAISGAVVPAVARRV